MKAKNKSHQEIGHINLDNSRLKTNEDIYKQLFYISEKAILILNEKGDVLDASEKTEKLLGMDFNKNEYTNFSVFFNDTKNAKSKLKKFLKEVDVNGFEWSSAELKADHQGIINSQLAGKKIRAGKKTLFKVSIEATDDLQFDPLNPTEKSNINRQLIESAYDAILIMDDEKFIMCNHSALDIFGCTNYDELVYHSPWEFSPALQPDGSDSMLKAKLYINEALAGKPKRFNWLHIKKDGSELEAEVSLNAINFKGGKYIQAIVRDNSFRNQFEREVRESETLFKSLFNNINAGLALHEIILDKNGNPMDFTFLAVNPVYEKITKLKSDEIIGKQGTKVIPNIEQKWIDTYGKVALTGESISIIDHSEYLNKWWDVKAFSPKKGQFAVVLADITEQKLNQLKLENNKISLQQAEEIGQLGFYERNWQTGKGFWSKGFFKLLGFTDKEEAFTHEEFTAYIHPEDEERTTAHVAKSLKEGTLMDVEFRISQHGGGIIWVHGTGKTIYDQTGKPVRTTGLFRDITETRRMKTAIDKFFEQPFNIHLIVDFEGKALEINKGWENITGFTKADIIGNNISKFLHPDDIESTQKEISKLSIGITTFYYVNRYKSKNGGYIWLAWSAIASIEDKLIYAVASDITESRKARKELEAQNIRFSNLISNIKGMVYRCKNDRDWTMEFVSDGCLEVTGYSADHFINKELSFNDIILPKYRDNLWNTWQKNIDANHPVMVEYEIQTASGEIKWVWEKGLGIYNDKGELTHLEGIISDITDRKHAEEQAKKLSTAVEQSPESIVITDKVGTIEYVNPQFTKLTGYAFDEAIGQNPRILQSGDHDQVYYKNLWGTILKGNTWYGEFHNRKKNGELYWERASISPIFNHENKITHFVAVKEDITQDKKLLAKLKEAKEQAEESDRLKSAFLANMSHEIRTPMNGIMGFAELLKEPGLSGKEQEKYAGVILKSGERMLNIINDLIDISKIEAGQMELMVSNTNLNEQLDFLFTFFKPEADSKSIELICKRGLPNAESIIITDKEKLYAILTNLLKNAMKYTHEGTVEYGYMKKDDPDGKKSFLQFYVSDTGIGVAKERQQAIFERFVQADLQISKPYEGAGLGLAITKAYTELLGGNIWVESEPGTGSTFYFTLPYHTKKTTNPKEPGQRQADFDESKLQNLRILVAEDDDIADLFLSEILEGNCRELLHVKTGDKAVEICKSDPDIDLVLMDIKMPVMDGYTATREIRKFNKELVIIAQTAYALAGDEEKALEAGCNGYIAKPIHKNRLLTLLNDLTEKKANHDEK